MNDCQFAVSGRFEITALDAVTGREIFRIPVQNKLTEIHRSFRNSLLTGQTENLSLDDLKLKYFAFGDGTSDASAGDTALSNERYRKQITQVTTENNAVRSICSLSANEANFTITEIGVFGGTDAALTRDSGTLLARVNVSIEKNENLILNIVRIDSTAI